MTTFQCPLDIWLYTEDRGTKFGLRIKEHKKEVIPPLIHRPEPPRQGRAV